MIFDTHAHYDDERYDEDREVILASLAQNGIKKVVNVACDMKSVRTSLLLSENYDFMYAAVGVHPDYVEELTEKDLHLIEGLAEVGKAKLNKVVAIGECGLDYYGREIPKETQIKWFRRQAEIANRIEVPLIVHSREAAKDTYDVLKETKYGENAGVIHCFSYSKEMAKNFLDLGYMIGVGGVVTFKNAEKLKEVVSYVPLDRIVLETDCPYLAPQQKRGQRNNSNNLEYVVAEIAELRGISKEEVEEITWKNAMRLYRISEEA